MLTPDEAMDTYIALWNSADDVDRQQLAERALTEEGLIIYPGAQARGRNNVVAAIRSLREAGPGVRFVLTSGIEHHDGWLRASWRMLNPDGSVVFDGVDVGQLAEDGRIRQMIGFHDPLPPLA